METRDRTPLVAWVVLGILAVSSVLAVVASAVSGELALGVILGGVAIALLLAWAAQSPGGDRHPRAT